MQPLLLRSGSGSALAASPAIRYRARWLGFRLGVRVRVRYVNMWARGPPTLCRNSNPSPNTNPNSNSNLDPNPDPNPTWGLHQFCPLRDTREGERGYSPVGLKINNMRLFLCGEVRFRIRKCGSHGSNPTFDVLLEIPLG